MRGGEIKLQHHLQQRPQQFSYPQSGLMKLLGQQKTH